MPSHIRTPHVLILTLLLFAAPLSGSTAAPESAAPAGDDEPAAPGMDYLHIGERLVLRLSWGIFGNAGETRIETTREQLPEGERIVVRVRTESHGIVDAFYPLSNNSVSIIDPATGHTLRVETEGHAGSRDTHAITIYDYEAGLIRHTDFIRPSRNATVPLTDDDVHDLMVTMMEARTWNMQPGESRDVKCTFEDDFYDFDLRAVKVETVRTPSGRYEAIQLEPRPKGELQGLFRKGGSIKFWISRGPEPQIVRIDTRAPRAGTITASLAAVEKISPDATHSRP